MIFFTMDENGLVDKGFELVYYNLSYRRRFIRSLWCIPWTIAILALIQWVFGFSIFLSICGIVSVIGFIAQAAYNHRKWKQEEREKRLKIEDNSQS